jgi:DNA-binding HxlR family transcriptional regulator
MKQEVTKRLPVPEPSTHTPSAPAHLSRCSVIATLKVFATKWKPCILCYLSEQPMRYNQLLRIIPNISRRMLSEHLRQLEKDKLINRKSYDRKNQHVEYSLTEKGRSLMPLMEEIQNWGMEHLDSVLSIRQMLSNVR